MHKLAKKVLTVQDYLELEEAAEYKSEYYKGEIFAMAGGSSNHNRIALNLASHLNIGLMNTKCQAFISDLRVWVASEDFFTYPDIFIVCNKIEYYLKRTDTILNPIIIIEVLSKSTEAYDRGKKFQFYRSIPSFQEYILIDQYSIQIDQFFIGTDGNWVFTAYNDINKSLKFSKIDFEIPLEKIYHLVDFELAELSAESMAQGG
ncbi:Uma2 family endonuclease [candidate division KSB1 bacterium]|nr:Uma2 family endonuclease [candidate division KSB1 bacterium]